MALKKYGEMGFNQSSEKTDVYLDDGLMPDIGVGGSVYFEHLAQISLDFGAADTSKQVAISAISDLVAGESRMFEISIPNWSNNVEMSFKILSPNGVVLYSMDNMPRNQLDPPAIIQAQRPLAQGTILKCVLEGAPGGTGGTVTIDSFILRNGGVA